MTEGEVASGAGAERMLYRTVEVGAAGEFGHPQMQCREREGDARAAGTPSAAGMFFAAVMLGELSSPFVPGVEVVEAAQKNFDGFASTFG